MSVADPILWLGDETGSAPSRITFKRVSQPRPIPLPYYATTGGEALTMGGAASPGVRVRFPEGYDNGILSVEHPFLTLAQYLAIETLYLRWVDGARPLVQFNNSYYTYKCKWLDFKPTHATRRRTDYPVSARYELLIKERL